MLLAIYHLYWGYASTQYVNMVSGDNDHVPLVIESPTIMIQQWSVVIYHY